MAHSGESFFCPSVQQMLSLKANKTKVSQIIFWDHLFRGTFIATKDSNKRFKSDKESTSVFSNEVITR